MCLCSVVEGGRRDLMSCVQARWCSSVSEMRQGRGRFVVVLCLVKAGETEAGWGRVSSATVHPWLIAVVRSRRTAAQGAALQGVAAALARSHGEGRVGDTGVVLPWRTSWSRTQNRGCRSGSREQLDTGGKYGRAGTSTRGSSSTESRRIGAGSLGQCHSEGRGWGSG